MHAAMRPQGAQGVKDVVVRQIEQGARLLASPPHGVQVILQMPRGNLESICPRVLVLAGIAEHLQVQEEEVHAVMLNFMWQADIMAHVLYTCVLQQVWTATTVPCSAQSMYHMMFTISFHLCLERQKWHICESLQHSTAGYGNCHTA